MLTGSGATALAYLPFTYAGSGVPETAAQLMKGMDTSDIHVHALIPRVRQPLPASVTTKQTLPFPLRYGRWRHVSGVARTTLDAAMRREVRSADPTRTVAYFWSSYLPAPAPSLVREVGERGLPTVREMVTCATPTSRRILEALHRAHGIPGPFFPSAELVEHEREELLLYDFVLAGNAEVEASLVQMGIAPDRIVPVTFGWTGSRFDGDDVVHRVDHGIRVLYVGSLDLQKGTPDLLDAWDRAKVDGELVLVGNSDGRLQSRIDRAVSTGRVRHIEFTSDVAALYRSADIFVLPTHQEGGPQVTYEAAACGLPIITTPMGAARLVKTGETGIIVPAGDIEMLTGAIEDLARDPAVRRRLGEAARRRSISHEYGIVGKRRGELLRSIALREPVTTLADCAPPH